MKLSVSSGLLVLCASVPAVAPAQDTLPLVYGVENTAATVPAPYLPTLAQLPVIQPLPDPFAWADGRGRIAYFSDWRYRRAEIGSQIQGYEIGTKPPRPDTMTASYSGGVLTVNVTVNGRTLTLTSQVILPAGSGPFPAVIGMNSPTGSIPSTVFSSRNIAQITFSHDQVTTYNNPQNTDPYYQLYGPALNIDNTGQYSAWAWGVSRLIDGLELTQSSLPIDLRHIAVTGCSYAGKMALFAGAFDERIALTIAQESGGGGATSWRYSQTEPSGTVETIGATSHQWFSENMFQFSGGNVSKLPEDHHELCAMCAPRALYVTGNPDYTWLSNPSCYVNSMAVAQIYSELGVPDRFGFSIVGGHLHCQVPDSQIPEIGAFVDKFLLGIDTVATSFGDTPYDTDLSPWVTWTAPGLSNGASAIEWTALRFPANLQTGLDTSVTMRWTRVPDAAKYIFQLTSDPTFTSIDRSDSTTGDTIKSITGLARDVRYYWRVKLVSAAAVGLWSNIWSFITVSSPGKPHLLNAIPVQDETGFMTYTWNGVPYADQYAVQECTDQTFTRLFRSGSTPDTSITFSGHSDGQPYYWRVQAVNLAGSGLWSDVSEFTFSATGIKQESGVPAESSISQNYPNPFNPTTRIEFALAHTGRTRVVIYDLLGREVETLVDRELNVGYYEMSVDAANLPSGVYFYRIESPNFVQTKKMVVMR